MDILTTPLFEKQYKEILELLMKIDFNETKKFKMHLDTVILNMSTKEKKYKKSIYFDNENIKDIEFQGCIIVFLIDTKHNKYVILGITYKNY